MSTNIVQSFIDSEIGKEALGKNSAIEIGSNCDKNIAKFFVYKDFPMYEYSQEKSLIGYEKTSNYILISDKNIYLNLQSKGLLWGKTQIHQIPIEDIIFFKMKKIHFNELLEVYYKNTFLGEIGNTDFKTSPLKFFEALFDFSRKFSNDSQESIKPTSYEKDNIGETENLAAPDQKLSKKLDDMIQIYAMKGYTLVHSDSDRAQMTKRKRFSIILFIILIIVGFVPGLIYLAYYMFVKKDETVFIRKNANGEIVVSES
jgi:hypothetical protein